MATDVAVPDNMDTTDRADGNAAATPKKRRRRAAATGAADDCFTCKTRETQCDRKRPYCSQCLEVGNECSGYKTTLTWGVGVASRGKLRGLSCPIAKTTGPGSVEPKRERTARPRVSSTSQPQAQPLRHGSLATQAGMSSFSMTPTNHPVKLEPAADVSPTEMMPNVAQQTWFSDEHSQQQQQQQQQPTSNASHDAFHSHLSHFGTSFAESSAATSFPVSAPGFGGYSDAAFASPTDYTQGTGSMYADGHSHFFGNPFGEHQLPDLSVDDPASLRHPSDAYHSASMSSVTTMQSLEEQPTTSHALQHPFPSVMIEQTGGPSHSPLDYSHFDHMFDDLNSDELNAETDTASEMTLNFPKSLYSTPFFHLSPRMQTLLDFYDKHICSVLVAFDGAANPYRLHILQLATHNEGLQNAIAALTTNNMRMRDLQAERTGFIEELAEDDSAVSAMTTRLANTLPTPEESCYKALSIEQLNMQLANPGIAQDDSVLATLLILCLFHVCDSGFSKFKTQLAGVQKLLSLRNRESQSGLTGWVEMFFTWFDVMTSTVNDRECEIKGESLDMLDFSANLGALEQFSGCDGRLFKLIARLGGLNLLSQGRPTRSNSTSEHTTTVGPQPPLRSQQSGAARYRRLQKLMKRRQFDPMEFDRLDGNGWGAPLFSSDEDVAGPVDDEIKSADTRHEFWADWHDIRSRLQSWSMDYSAIPSPSGAGGHGDFTPQLGPEQRDMVHINESFRSSALLYTERLAHPHLPSSAPNFQNLVSQALFHITAMPVTSCVNKFLLWPLFITGTECIDVGHRAMVRARCVEIQRESGFFNNLSVLEVLERVWRETGNGMVGGENEEVRRRRRDSTGGDGSRWGQAFRWRKAMNRVDGEYIIV